MSKENAEKFLDMMGRFVDWQKQNRNKFYYLHSTYGIVKSEDSAVETWMYVDEYKDQESYDKFNEDFQSQESDYAGFIKIRDEFESLIIPNSYTCKRLIEKPELHVT